MDIRETKIPGVAVVQPRPFYDERGLFARTWDPDVFVRHGLEIRVAQCSTSWNARAGTLRGMHYQEAPHDEAKLVRCTAGAIFDVAVDLRPDSPTYTQWFGVELTAENRTGLHIARGCAHGFMSLTDGTEVHYQISAAYRPEAARGVRWDDPALGIAWPREPVTMSDRDRAWPDLSPDNVLA